MRAPVAVLVALVLAGCGGKASTPPPATTSAPDVKPAAPEECQTLVDLEGKIAQALQGAAGSDTTEPRRLLNDLSHTADEQIRPDIAVIAAAYTKLVGAMEDVDAGNRDAASLQRLQKVLAGIDTGALSKANANVTAWVQQHC